MGILKKVGEFLLGKDPDIFDDKGRVIHRFPKRKWEDWQNRYIKSKDYNWREHTGAKAGSAPTNPAKN